MKNNGRKSGFTLAEVLIVVGIVAVLAAFGILAVANYTRTMAKIEYDAYAKELFIAAQNNLTMAESQGYLGRTHGSNETEIMGESDDSKSVCYFVVDSSHDRSRLDDSDSVLNLMLPPGALDETIRSNENSNYIVRYHKDAGIVLDVFYWAKNGRYAHQYIATDYAKWVNKQLMLKKQYEADQITLEKMESELNSYFRKLSDDGSVIGYYGGEQAKDLSKGDPLEAPTIIVTNGDKLEVKVSNPNPTNDKARLNLVISGEESGKTKTLELTTNMTSPFVTYDKDKQEYTITLDDITRPGMNFKDLLCGNTPDFEGGNLIPGENIKIHAVAFNNTQITNVANSPEQKTNSLFGTVSVENDKNTAHIGSFRHLANLSSDTSGVNEEDYASAKQFTDINWNKFKENTNPSYSYIPVDRNYPIKFAGESHIISDLTIGEDRTDSEGNPVPPPENAGLFAVLPAGSEVSDLVLTDVNVKGSVTAGALAGVASGSVISNVAVFDDKAESTVTGTGSCAVGGLVGIAAGNTVGGITGPFTGSITGCAASVIVSGGSGDVGGLVGTADRVNLSACHTGGHTENGEYKDEPNVKGTGNVGGLVGNLNYAVVDGIRFGTVEHSYSTCSAGGGTVGGLIGSSNGYVTDCYAVGRVTGNGSNSGALIGSQSGIDKLEGCSYLESINEKKETDGTFTYLPPVGGSTAVPESRVKAIDKDAASYEEFIGGTRDHAYTNDSTLGNEFPYLTVGQLLAKADSTYVPTESETVHIGDWPSPQTDIINIK